MKCRHCANKLKHPFLDLGFAPPSNAYLKEEHLSQPELYFPLRLNVCTHCWLVQTEDYSKAEELFTDDYAYFSSTSSSWVRHAKNYVDSIVSKLSLNEKSFVIEIASNDGYLLRNFVEKKIPCLGIEPTQSTASAAEQQGIPTLRDFFGLSLSLQLRQADLIIGNNVYAHVPDINDFTQGLKRALKPGGTITLEFPHLMRLLEHVQFDTVYHEHFSYLSLYTVQRIFSSCGLRVFDVEELSTHGGSLRVYGCHEEDQRVTSQPVSDLIALEAHQSLRKIETYLAFQNKANFIKNHLVSFLLTQQEKGAKLAAYGAAAKGNTLLNYAGIKRDMLPFICDAAPSKQGKYLPGSHIPIKHPTELIKEKPDHVLILPWNLADEIIKNMGHVREWGGHFVTCIPKLQIW